MGAIVPLAGSFVPVGTADGEKTLEPSEDRGWIVCIQELDGEVEKGGPPIGKVVVQYSLKNGNKLMAD